jgi:pyruvate ferredoxin oxidoreductase gamma subunit
MANITEIRWHARGGLGAVTTAKTLAEVLMSKGKYVQAFPEYGPERRGAPVTAYNRISDEEILLHTPVKNPNIVVVGDPTLINSPGITLGTDDKTIFIINTSETTNDILSKIGNNRIVYTVDATKISLETIGKAMPNGPLIAAVIKVTDLMNLEQLMDEVKKSLMKIFDEQIVQANLEALRRVYSKII